MDVIALLKCLTSNNTLGKNISRYLRNCDYKINYYEYRLLWMVYPKIFEKYIFSLYSHGENYSYYFLQENLIDSLTRFSTIYKFNVNLNPDTEHLYTWNEKWIDFIMKLIQKDFNMDKIYKWLLQSRKDMGIVPWTIYYYVNNFFLIYLSKQYEIVNPDKWIIKLILAPKWDSRPSGKKAEKIIYHGSFLENAHHFLNLINERVFENIIFITKNKRGNKRKIHFFKNYFLMSKCTWVNVKIHKPLDSMNIHLSENNLFIVFEDSRDYFDRLSYFRNYGILCIDEPQ